MVKGNRYFKVLSSISWQDIVTQVNITKKLLGEEDGDDEEKDEGRDRRSMSHEQFAVEQLSEIRKDLN